MKVIYTETALAEVDEICSYIERDNPIAAADIAAAILLTIARLASRPKSAPIVHGEKVRAKLVSRYQYRIFFRGRRRYIGHQKCPQHKAAATMGNRGSWMNTLRSMRAKIVRLRFHTTTVNRFAARVTPV